MNPLARRRAKAAPDMIDAGEARQQAAINASLAQTKAERDKQEAIAEVVQALGFPVAINVEVTTNG